MCLYTLRKAPLANFRAVLGELIFVHLIHFEVFVSLFTANQTSSKTHVSIRVLSKSVICSHSPEMFRWQTHDLHRRNRILLLLLKGSAGWYNLFGGTIEHLIRPLICKQVSLFLYASPTWMIGCPIGNLKSLQKYGYKLMKSTYWIFSFSRTYIADACLLFDYHIKHRVYVVNSVLWDAWAIKISDSLFLHHLINIPIEFILDIPLALSILIATSCSYLSARLLPHIVLTPRKVWQVCPWKKQPKHS